MSRGPVFAERDRAPIPLPGSVTGGRRGPASRIGVAPVGYSRGVSGEPLRVLIAEDEALIRLDLAEMLAEEGYAVAGEAGDGAQAVALAASLRPDLAILDVKMPV